MSDRQSRIDAHRLRVQSALADEPDDQPLAFVGFKRGTGKRRESSESSCTVLASIQVCWSVWSISPVCVSTRVALSLGRCCF